MSKSLGNFITAKDALEAYDPMVIRWILLSAHYRQDLNISDDFIKANEKELNKVLTCLKQVSLKLALNDAGGKELDEKYYHAFLWKPWKMISILLMLMQRSLRWSNISIRKVRKKDFDLEALNKVANTFKRALDVLGIRHHEVHLSAEDKKIYEAWNEAKAQRIL